MNQILPPHDEMADGVRSRALRIQELLRVNVVRKDGSLPIFYRDVVKLLDGLAEDAIERCRQCERQR